MSADTVAAVMADSVAMVNVTLVVGLLCAALFAATARRLWRRSRGPADARPSLPWTLAILALQIVNAALLALLLFPPSRPGLAGTIDVLTANSDRAARAHGAAAEYRIALPEATRADGAERMPDLATALRRWPGTTRLRVVGSGLVARDRDAVAGRSIHWLPAPLPSGIVGLHPPAPVAAGQRFSVSGRIQGVAGGSVKLLDPSGAIAARAALPETVAGASDSPASFTLSADARTPGATLWRVELRDARRLPLESLTVPVQVVDGQPARVLMLAGAPNAELKYLRRWAVDAGLRLDTRIDLGGGLQVGNAPALDAASLASADLVVLDQRAWQGLAASQRTALDDAVDDGLGLLIRLTDPLTAADRTRLQRLGIDATPAVAASDVQLPAGFARMPPSTPDAGGVATSTASQPGKLPAIARAPLRLGSDDGVIALRDATGTPLAVWHGQGRGRVGVSSIDDSYRLVLAGRARVHGQLWASLLAALARPEAGTAIHIDDDPRIGQRVAICGIGDAAVVDRPRSAGTQSAVPSTPLRVDPATDPRRCAAFWPTSAGWHRVRDGRDDALFHVRAAGEAPGLIAASSAEATAALLAIKPSISSAAARQPGPRWPWLLGWLASVALLWWLERRGRVSRRPAIET